MMEPAAIIQKMLLHDKFSEWLGIEVLEVRNGFVRLGMVIRPEMCNGFGIAHGGILYSLADSALAFASNSSGRHSLSIETSISHLKSLVPGERVMAEASLIHEGNTIAQYHVKISGASQELVADFKGTVFRKNRLWE